MKRLHLLSIATALLLGGCDAGNLLEDSGTTAQEFNADTPLTTKVVGGTTVDEGVYPWVASLATNYNKGLGYDHKCGGSLIDERWVLTAANCIVDGNGEFLKKSVLYVAVGTTDLDSQNIEYIGVTNIIVHPDYSADGWPYNLNDDIALVQLESAPGNEPISIPRWKSTPVVGETITIAGWGHKSLDATDSESELREADMLVRSADLCHPWYEHQRHEPDNLLGSIDYSELACAGGTAEKVASGCSGDGGAPAFVTRQNGEIVQAGIAVAGWGCGTGGIPGLYTKVAKYQSWIASEITPASTYKGGSEDVVVDLEYEQQAEWVRMDADDSVTGNMDIGDVGRYRLAETKTVTLTGVSGNVDLLVYDSWRMDPEDIVCTSDNNEEGVLDICELDSRGTYYARVIAWADTSYKLENE